MVCPWCEQEFTGPYWEHLAFDPPRGCPQVSYALGRALPRKYKQAAVPAKPVKKKGVKRR